jgi:hypothetical protein
MVKVKVVQAVGLVVLAGCGGTDDASGPPRDGATVARELAGQACGTVTPHGAVRDIDAAEMRELSRVYGDAVHPVIKALVKDPGNSDYSDLVSALGMAEVTWETAAEVVEAHGGNAATWDAETTGDFDQLVARVLDYEAQVDAVCQGYS